MVRDFTAGIGDEARAQCLERYGRLPTRIAACVGGGSNAIGLFTAFLDDDVEIHGFEPGGDGVETGRHAATITPATPACCTAPAPTCSRTRTARPSSPTRSRPGSTTRASGPQHAHLAGIRPGDVHAGDRRRGDGGAGAAQPDRGDHPGHRVRARDRRRRRGRARATAPTPSCWSTSPAAATRTWRPPSSGSTSATRAVDPAGARRMSAAVAFEKARADGRAALVGYLPAGFPDVDGGIAALRAMVDAGCDVIEVGLPYSDPVHGRADDPGRGPAGARRRRPHPRRAADRRGGRRDRHPDAGHDLLEPGRAVRRGAVRRRPRRRRGSRADHPRPHARQRARLDRGRRRPRPRQGLPGRAVLDRRADRDDHARPAAGSSTRRR